MQLLTAGANVHSFFIWASRPSRNSPILSSLLANSAMSRSTTPPIFSFFEAIFFVSSLSCGRKGYAVCSFSAIILRLLLFSSITFSSRLQSGSRSNRSELSNFHLEGSGSCLKHYNSSLSFYFAFISAYICCCLLFYAQPYSFSCTSCEDFGQRKGVILGAKVHSLSLFSSYCNFCSVRWMFRMRVSCMMSYHCSFLDFERTCFCGYSQKGKAEMLGWNEGLCVCMALQQLWNLEDKVFVCAWDGKEVRLWGKVVLCEWCMRVDSSYLLLYACLDGIGEPLRAAAFIQFEQCTKYEKQHDIVHTKTTMSFNNRQNQN